MKSYNVYFSPRNDVPKDDLIAQVDKFMVTQIDSNRAENYRILDMTGKASFQEIPGCHLIVDYESEADVQDAFRNMKKTYKEDPHAPLMRLVSEFQVAFSKDTD